MQRALGLSLRRGRGRETFEQPRDSPLVVERLEKLEAVAIERACFRVVRLLPGQIAHIRQRAADAPAVAEIPEHRQTLLVQTAGFRGVSLFARDVSQMIERPGGAGPVSKILEDFQALLFELTGQPIISLGLDDDGEVAQGAGDGPAIAERSPSRHVFLEEGPSRGNVPIENAGNVSIIC